MPDHSCAWVCAIVADSVQNQIGAKWNYEMLLFAPQIGALTMQIIEHEIKKYDLWKEELSRKQRPAGSGDKAVSKKDYEKTKKKFDGLVKKQDQLLRGL